MRENTDSRADLLLEEALERLPQHDISTALKKLQEAAQNSPTNLQILNLIANCYYVLGEFPRAEASWKQVLEIEPSNKIALAKLKSFKSPSFQFWLKRYSEALNYIDNKNYVEAKNLLHMLLRENDGFVSVYKLLGLCYLALSDDKSARKVWKQGLKLDVNNEQLLAYINSKPGREQPAVKTSQTVILTEDKDNARLGLMNNKSRLVWVVSGVLCIALAVQAGISINNSRVSKNTIKEMQQKINSLSERIEQNAKAASVANLLPAKDHDDYEEDISMAGSMYDTDQEKHYYTTGYNAYLSGDWKTATSNLGVVVAMATHSYINREALYYLARTYYLQEDYKNAEKYYLKYLEEFPDSNYTDDSLYYLGCVYYANGNIEKAREFLSRLKEIKPKSGYTSTRLYKEVVTE